MLKGKILFTSYEKASNMDLEKFDIKLQIVRFTKQGLLSEFTHVPQLAPSENLFKETMYKWKKLKFSNEEKDLLRNGKTGTWFDLYELAFLKELGLKVDESLIFNIPFIKNTKSRNDLIKAYNRLKEHLNNGKNIIAICYCENSKRCHRSILGLALKNEGYIVEIE